MTSVEEFRVPGHGGHVVEALGASETEVQQ
jgi:hypothetical protein